MNEPISPESVPACSSAACGRRGFLARLVGWLAAGLTLLVPLGTAMVALLEPLRRKGQAGGFVRVAPLAAVPEDGTPLRANVVMDQQDAWSRAADQPVGAVFLRRVGPKQVVALSVVCPHEGCPVQYRETLDPGSGRKTGGFFCPCHAASFDLAGQRTDAVSPSPRDMDSLVVDAKRLERDGEVWVEFRKFK